MTKSQTRFVRILFYIILIELTLGGGGRFTAWGPVSLRMVLFFVALSTSLWLLAKGIKINPAFWKLLGAFMILCSIGVLVGSLNNAPIVMIWEDVKPLLYFLMLPFFAIAVQSPEDISATSLIIQTSAVIIAIVFGVTLLLIHSGVVPFLEFYNATAHTEELFFRGEFSFSFKGFLFLPIGMIFTFLLFPKRILIQSVLAMALLLSFTRGFMIALAITYACYCFINKLFLKFMMAATFGVALLFGGAYAISSLSSWMDHITNKEVSPYDRNPDLLGSRSYSDKLRITQMKEVKEVISIKSALIGHGFGVGVPSRPVHMEISYLEIFHKQGIIGLFFWLMFGWMLIRLYRQTPHSSPFASAFFYSSAFIFIQSAFNQYINNPIGLSVLLLSLVCMDILAKK